MQHHAWQDINALMEVCKHTSQERMLAYLHHAWQDINALMEVCKHAFLGSIHREMLHVKNALTENGLHLEVHTVTVLQLIVVKDTSAIVGTEVHVEMENTVTQVQYT